MDSMHQHIEHVTNVLQDEFPDVEPAVVGHEVEATFVGLERSSRVEPFIPILALRRSRERLELVEAEQSAVAAFVEPGDEPRFRPGDVAHLVDGRFQITHVEPTDGAFRYSGRWLDPLEA